MELPIVSALEFEQVKSSIKNYIKLQDGFTDYDFEGSNLSMLIDVLAYNTLYTSYNVNMAANELNLDTAVLRDNVVSIAKRLGYRSNSYTSSKIIANITIDNVSPYDYVTIKSGKVLTGSVNNRNYTFCNRSDLQINVKGRSSVTFTDVELVEGTEYSILYTVDSTNEHQRFFIPNNYIDSETIKAFVITDPTNTVEKEYVKKETIVDVKNSDEIFFVEEVQDQKYEVIFGDDVIGRKLRDGEIVKLTYIVTSGSQANGIRSEFKLAGNFVGSTGATNTKLNYSNISFSLVTQRSDGGSEYESIRSIKYRAPRYYASQERAVTLSDYESIIQQIYPNADLVRVTGGETLSPPQYGEVFISIKPKVGESVSEIQKKRIIRELNQYKVGSIQVNIIDPVKIKIIARPTIIYDESKTRNREFELISLVNESIQDYISKINFNDFGGEYSDLELRCRIKNLDQSIKFVVVPIYLSQLVPLSPGVEKLYEVDFFTSLNTDIAGDYYVLSDPFCHKNITEPVVLGSYAGCTGDNKIYLISIDGEVIQEVGSVNPDTGEIKFTINCCQDEPINIMVVPEVLDIIFGPDVVPEYEVTDTVIIEDDEIDGPGDIGETLDPDIPVLPSIGTLPSGVSTPTGDNDPFIGVTLEPLPGGFVPISPIVSPPLIPIDGGDGDDPNNFVDIEDFRPETDPNSCS